MKFPWSFGALYVFAGVSGCYIRNLSQNKAETRHLGLFVEKSPLPVRRSVNYMQQEEEGGRRGSVVDEQGRSRGLKLCCGGGTAG